MGPIRIHFALIGSSSAVDACNLLQYTSHDWYGVDRMGENARSPVPTAYTQVSRWQHDIPDEENATAP